MAKFNLLCGVPQGVVGKNGCASESRLLHNKRKNVSRLHCHCIRWPTFHLSPCAVS